VAVHAMNEAKHILYAIAYILLAYIVKYYFPCGVLLLATPAVIQLLRIISLSYKIFNILRETSRNRPYLLRSHYQRK
jgi:hypothetical protein